MQPTHARNWYGFRLLNGTDYEWLQESNVTQRSRELLEGGIVVVCPTVDLLWREFDVIKVQVRDVLDPLLGAFAVAKQFPPIPL
jgi:hypothetical protein